MKVFVTGGTGFIGRYLVRRLLHDGHDVFALVRDRSRGETLRREGARTVEGDLTGIETFQDALEGVEAVYHCGGLTGFWGISRDQYHRANVLGTRNILDASLRAGCPNVVHVSTALIHGPCKDDRPRTETDPPGTAISGYERSKVEAERLALSYAEEKGLNLKVVRLTSAYGPEGRLVPALVDGLLRKKIKIIGDGTNKKHITHVLDCVDGILAAADRGRTGTVYNIGSDEVPTMYETVELMARTLGVPMPGRIPRATAKAAAGLMEVVSRMTGRPPHLTGYMVDYLSLNHVYDTGLARRELGFTARIRLEDGIPSAVSEYLEKNGR
ncbi:MAG: NAD-dependent epimerase/dehydratase family protein [Nitrospirae bacterium]|nr:NAD-dependent epimerase/dehydratase family protein [Nitrospirota bacterium]